MVNVNANFQYTANFGPVIGQMEQLTRQANVLNNTLQNLDKQSNGLKQNLAGAFASDLGKIGGWNAKMVELTDSVDNFGQSLLKQKLTLKQYATEAIGSFSKASNAHKLAVREVSREMSQLLTLGKDINGKQMGMMITPATINLKDLNTQLAVSQKQWSIFNTLVQDGATHLINFGKNTQWAGRQITVGLTVPLTIYGNTVSKIFREVDAELTRFQKVYGGDLMNTTSDATAQMVSDVKQLAVEFSKSMGIAAKDTASLAADLAATGLEGQKLLASIRETTRLAVLGDVSNQDAMKTTLSLQNAFKMSTDDLAQSVNFLNAVENQTSLSLQDLTTAIPKAGPVIKALGGDVKDLSLLMVALKEGGISAAEGANALKSGMASLVNPTKKASETAKQYGIDINQIVQANRGQLMPTIVAFQQQLQLLDDFGKAQVIENVFGKYQFARISALFDNLNASASQTNAVLGLMGKSNKELAATAYQEMDTLMNSSSKRFQRAIEGIKAQFITIGGSITSAITPILENVMGKIQKAIEFFQNLPKPVKSFIKVATGLTAIAGPIIMMVGIFSNFLGYIGKGAMGMVNLGRRMAGLPTQKFEMLTDTQMMAQKATQQLANSFDVERTSVERLNQALSIYKQNLVEAISLNPGFLNRQISAVTTTGNPPKAKFQTGGSAWVPGSGNGDKIPAMLEPGEYVVNKKAASQYGPALDHINYNAAPRFQSGGRVPGYASESYFPGPGFSFDPSKHVVLANGKIMNKAEYDRRVSITQGTYPMYDKRFPEKTGEWKRGMPAPRGYELINEYPGLAQIRVPVRMRDEVNPYLNAASQANVGALTYNSRGSNPFVGPLPQISYQVQGRMRPGSGSSMYGYPFKSQKEADDFGVLNYQEFGGYGAGSKTSNIRRSINDPEQQAFADWIGGHNSSQFRAGSGHMKIQSMAGHRQHMLNNMAPISESISLYRGTVLDAKTKEFGGTAGYRNLMLALKYNLLDKGIGQEIKWSDLQSFSSIPQASNYSKFIESWTKPSNANSKKSVDKKLASMDMIPVIFHLLNARGQSGFNISNKAMVQEVMGKPVNEKEWVLNKPSGRVAGIHQDISTRNFIVDLMQNGGRVQSHANDSYREPFQRTDVEYETVFKWIKGELDYFRRRKNVKGRWTDSEKYDAERYAQLLSTMRSVPEGTKMMRGSVLNPGMSGEMSKEAQLAMLTAIQTGDYGSLYGMEISFNDFASFASDVMGTQYGPRGSYGIDRFSSIASANLYKPGLFNRDTPSGKFHDDLAYRTLPGRQSKHGSSPVMYDFTAGPNTRGRDITMGKEGTAPYPNYNPGWVSGVQINEILTHRAKGSITGVSSDLKTRQPIIHIQGHQSGGRIGSAAGGLAFAHIVPPAKTPSGLGLQTLPFGLTIPGDMNRALDSSAVDPRSLVKSFANPMAEDKMASLLGLYGEKDPQGLAETIRTSLVSKLSRFKNPVNDKTVYEKAMGIPMLKNKYNEYLKSGKLYDVRSRITDDKLIASGWGLSSERAGVKTFTKNGKTVYYGKRKGQSWNTVWGKDGKSLSTDTQTRSIGKRDPFNIEEKLSWLEQDVLGYQSGGRVNGYATETATWAKKAAAPKAYAGVLQNIPDWATKGNEYEAIVSALRDAGIPEADKLAGYYIQDVLAHINPSTTNENGVYEKVWAAANLMKDSQLYNVFLETINSRKDVGGLLNPSTVARVAGDSGLPVGTVQAELTKIADGVHPNTANGAKVMMSLARLFPSRTKPGITTGVAAGLGARLQGNFYSTLGQRALPSNLPTTTVRSYDPKGAGAPTSRSQGSRVRATGLIMPSGAVRQGIVMPNIQSINSAAGGSGSKATVKVDGNGNVLSNGIDDMVAHTVTGQPIAVSSKELLAISSGGLIAGVTSPGDEARGQIVHPMGTALMRGKKFEQIRSAANGMSDAVYDQPVAMGGMDKFAGRMMMMVGAVDQMRFAMNQFTSETSNGTSKWVAALNLALTGTQMIGQDTGRSLMARGKEMQGLKMRVDPKTLQPMVDAQGNPIYRNAPSMNPSRMSSGLGKAMAGLGKAANFLGNPLVQIGLQAGIMAVNKTIELYQKAMENARKSGNAAFAEPTETAKLLGVELKSLTASAEKYGKAAEKVFGAQGKGAYDKVFEKTVKTDFQDLIDVLKKAKTEQEQLNQLTNVYANLIERGMDPKNAKEITAEIARQSQAMGAFNKASGALDNIKNSKDAVKAQLETFQSQMTILEERRKQSQQMGGKDIASAALGSVAMIPGMTLFGRGVTAASGSALKTKSSDLRADAVNEFFGVQGDEFWKKALRGTGLDRNPIAQALGGYLADQTMKTQMAAQLGATIKSIFSIAADNPTASNEALRMLVSQFKSVDWKKATEELSKIAEEQGFGDLSQVGQFINSDQFKNLGEQNQTIFLAALNAGLGPQLEKDLAKGWGNVDWQKIAGQAAENQALVSIDAEIDIQLKDSMDQLEKLKSAIQESFTAAIEAKQKELEYEDKRHEKTLKNLDTEAQRLQLKKETLSRNTEYYIKELQKEKEAEDYYARQRQTGLTGLKALSQGDVFGFIGAQMEAATTADQFGRDRSMQNIQDTSDAAQAKLDQDLKGIDDRKAAEDARHEAEVKNINSEIEFLQKKQSAAVGSVEKATTLLEKAMAMSPGDKGYQKAIIDAQQAANAAGMSGQQVMQQLNVTSPDKDIQARIDSASKSLGDAMTIITGDTTDAIDRLNDADTIAKNVFASLGVDPAKTNAYKDLFDTLQKPLDPTVSAAIQAFKYGAVNNQETGTLGGPPISPKSKSSNKGISAGRFAGLSNTLADGGLLSGPGTGTSDSIPAMLSNGEFVMSAASVKKYGVGAMNAINTKKFASGGFVGSSAPSAPKYNIPSVGVSSNPSPIAAMAGGGMVGSSSMSHSAPTQNFNFNGAGMDMVMHHVNKAVGGRINSNSRRIG